MVALIAVAGTAAAQNGFNVNANPIAGPVGPGPDGPCGPITITHSSSQTITALNSVSCNSVAGHTDNSYFRAFDLASFGIVGDFDVCAVEVGIEQSTAPGGTQPMDINLSTSSPAFPGGVLTPIGTGSFSVANGLALVVNSFAVTGTAPAGSELVVEVFTPNGQAVGNFFFIGSNASPETGASYLQAADCGVAVPTPVATIGFPNMHIVVNVVGTEVGGDADLDVVKGASVNPDDTVDFDITVTNNGPADATNVVVTDDLPPCTVYISDDCGGMNVPPWTWNVGNLPVNTSATCTVTVDASGCEGLGPIINTAVVTADQTDPNPGNESSEAEFEIGGGAPEIPTLGRLGVLALIALLIGLGVWRLRSS